MKKYLKMVKRFLEKLMEDPRVALRKIEFSWLKRTLKTITPKHTSISDSSSHSDYLAICQLAAEREDVFKIFKGLEGYGAVLEHVSREQGQECLDIIKAERAEDLLVHFSKFKENDAIGNPRTFNYDVGKFSPTTLRYVKVLTDLRNIFGELNNFSIVEIGGGMEDNVKSYRIFLCRHHIQ